MAGGVKAGELLAAAESGDAALMQELKKSLDRKCMPQTIPDSLDGQVSHDSILERFKECYQTLFNSAETVEAMVNIKYKLEQLINVNSAREVEKVTADIVKQACCRMKPGKTGLFQ